MYNLFQGFWLPDGEHVKIPVAIKVLIEGTSPSQSTELLDEARVMASVDHPCCIKIVAVCMTAEMMLITPLMPQGCLLSYIKSQAGHLGSKVLVNWCVQISKVSWLTCVYYSVSLLIFLYRCSNSHCDAKSQFTPG